MQIESNALYVLVGILKLHIFHDETALQENGIAFLPGHCPILTQCELFIVVV